MTLVGPHRDDLVLKLGELPARGYASHGESWSFALSLRLASYELLKSEGNEPVLVLDDVFAELDARRRERLAELVAPGEQVLVTAAVRGGRTGGAGGGALLGLGRGGRTAVNEGPPQETARRRTVRWCRRPGSRASPAERGVPSRAEPTGVDLARVALRAAKEQARARGAAAQQKRDVRRGSGPRSGAGRDGRDPLPLGAAVRGLITERGWEVPAAVGGVMGRWPQLVGPEVAQHCEPERLRRGGAGADGAL